MNYLGGKHRQGRVIASYINKLTCNGVYVEPFCGACGVAVHVNGPKVLSDIHLPLINMWKAVINGVSLPDVISEEDYETVRVANDPDDWRTAYIGFGMSFGSKYWGGYTRNLVGRNYALNLKKSMSLKRSRLLESPVSFLCLPYWKLPILDDSVVYLDPPYANRTRQHKFDFDSDHFWEWAGFLSERCFVLVTEFTVPNSSGWEVLHTFGDTVVRHHSSKTRGDGTTEVLVVRGKSKLELL